MPDRTGKVIRIEEGVVVPHPAVGVVLQHGVCGCPATAVAGVVVVVVVEVAFLQ
jgi:hypothetical protein